jgi:hypothetical protein
MLRTNDTLSEVWERVVAACIAIVVGTVALLPISVAVLALANMMLTSTDTGVRISYFFAVLMAPTGMMVIGSLKTCWELLDY